jgi:hypothetical protein
MTPRKQSRQQNIWLGFESYLVKKLSNLVYLITCVVIYALLLRQTLPNNLALILFGALILQGFSSGHSMGWVSALARGILKVILDTIPK